MLSSFGDVVGQIIPNKRFFPLTFPLFIAPTPNLLIDKKHIMLHT